eukprot:1155106-Pelagomonas_calceolata.AAC.2
MRRKSALDNLLPSQGALREDPKWVSATRPGVRLTSCKQPIQQPPSLVTQCLAVKTLPTSIKEKRIPRAKAPCTSSPRVTKEGSQ